MSITTPAREEATDLVEYSLGLARQARLASRVLANAHSALKDRWLQLVAEELLRKTPELLTANERDLAEAIQAGLPKPQLDRLRLTSERIREMAEGMRAIASLPDPVGQIRSTTVRPNGLVVHKVGVPLGVIFFIYESRPNVTVDAAALSVKSGNAILLRGGREALRSNSVLHRILQDGLRNSDLPPDAVQLVTSPGREVVGHLLRLKEYIDLAIPRGGESLIRRVAEEARMPVLKHYQGNCHVFVERTADLDRAERIVLNAKCQRPGVCNAAESLLIDAPLADTFLPGLATRLCQRGVELRGCPETCRRVALARPATDADYAAEYLDLILSIKVVHGWEEAIQHINKYGSGHTDAIVTSDLQAARRFTAAVDSAAVLVNASTRFNDGYELGLGGEIGISTDKFHARGPCGLVELTSYKYVVYGEGQVKGE
jgi:glutamate-5-semialdehyde dehydrogenase